MCRSSLVTFLACLPLFGATSTATSPVALTVVLDIQNQHYSSSSVSAMKAEASRILNQANLALDWRMKSDLSDHPEFTNVVVFKLTGSCTMNEGPMMFDERGPLALTFTSDGEVLPFGEVHCDRVKAALSRSSSPISGFRCQSLLGVALGRVMAHEMYHMLAEESHHTGEGVSRTSLRADELVTGRLMFDHAALTRISERMRTGQMSSTK